MDYNMKDKIKITLLFLLIIFVILCILIYYLSVNKASNDDFQKLKSKTYDNMMKEMILPKGMLQLQNSYEGDYNTQDFYKSIKEFSEEIIILSKNKSKDLENYFQKNENEIKETTGVSNFDEFKKINEVAKSKGELKALKSAVIDTESFGNFNKYLKFNIMLVFDDNIELNFEVHFMNHKSSVRVARYYVIQDS